MVRSQKQLRRVPLWGRHQEGSVLARGEDLWSQVPAYPESDQKSFPFLHVVPILQKQGGGGSSGGCCGGEEVATGCPGLLFDLVLSGGLFHVAHAGAESQCVSPERVLLGAELLSRLE